MGTISTEFPYLGGVVGGGNSLNCKIQRRVSDSMGEYLLALAGKLKFEKPKFGL
jgi:hypothetical protein